MESVKYWAVSLIAACLIGSIYSFLIPSKSFHSVLKLGFTAFLISVMILPLVSGFKEKDYLKDMPAANSYSSNTDYINEAIINQASQNVKQKIESLLNRKKFVFKAVNITMNIDKNGSIVINEVMVSGVPDYQKQSLYDYLKKQTGLEVTVKSD